MNAAQQITGYYVDAADLYHGFARGSDGTLTTFDAPGASTSYQGTIATSISAAGVVVGGFNDASNVLHAFMRAPSGTMTTFDAPGAGVAAYQGTRSVHQYCWHDHRQLH